MSPISIDPSFSTGGAEWGVGKIDSSVGGDAQSSGFGGILGQQLQQVAATQTDAAEQSRQLATGEATDPTQVVMSVEKAQLAMQMATTMRNKGVEAIQELMRTQV